MNKDNRFLIVGLGLMGGSYAMGLSKKGYLVDAIDKNPEALKWARKNNLIQRGALPEEAAPLLQEADSIILALYPKDILPFLQKNKVHFKKGARITDLAGVKGCFIEEAQDLLEPDFEFIASHPMAGKEVSGVENADNSIFFKANFIITPTSKNTKESIEFAYNLAKTLEFAHITELTPKEHDKMIGYVSQLTHAIAVSLMNANSDPHLPEVTGDSFRDLTRIADINAELWSELFLSNAHCLSQQIALFTACLQDLNEKLVAGDAEGLKQLFRNSTLRRREFGKTTP